MDALAVGAYGQVFRSGTLEVFHVDMPRKDSRVEGIVRVIFAPLSGPFRVDRGRLMEAEFPNVAGIGMSGVFPERRFREVKPSNDPLRDSRARGSDFIEGGGEGRC